MRSVAKPWKALTSLIVIFLIVLVIYGIFGYAFFGPGSFLSAAGNGTDQPDLHCESLVSCLGLVLYGGIRSSDIASVMEPTYPGNPDQDFASRFFYDLLFFITIGALLFNMVTGIIVDTFSELRSDTDNRREGLENSSFVAGLTEEDLDDTDTSPGELDETTHSLWQYINYIVFLRSKDEDEYNGIESWIAESVKKNEPDWLPRYNCCSMQKMNIASKHGADGENSVTGSLTVIEHELRDLKTSILGRLSKLEDSMQKSKQAQDNEEN